jgi:hypothetical protein
VNYFSTQLSTLADPTFRRSDYKDRGIWVTLLAFCVLQENKGIIKGAKTWTEFEFEQVLGVRKECIDGTHHLWNFNQDDLVVWRYPDGDQAALEKQREANTLKARIKHLGLRIAALRAGRDRGDAGCTAAAVQAAEQELSSLYATLSALGQVRGGQGKSGQVRSGEGKKGIRVPRGSVLPAEVADHEKRLLAINAIMGRRDSTRWSEKEFAAFKAAGLAAMDDADFVAQAEAVRGYYGAPLPLLRSCWGVAGTEKDFRRRELVTLLNNWPGEVDRAEAWGRFVARKNEEDGKGRL